MVIINGYEILNVIIYEIFINHICVFFEYTVCQYIRLYNLTEMRI